MFAQGNIFVLIMKLGEVDKSDWNEPESGDKRPIVRAMKDPDVSRLHNLGGGLCGPGFDPR